MAEKSEWTYHNVHTEDGPKHVHSSGWTIHLGGYGWDVYSPNDEIHLQPTAEERHPATFGSSNFRTVKLAKARVEQITKDEITLF